MNKKTLNVQKINFKNSLKTRLAALLLSILLSPIAQAGLFNPESFTLPNGLQVIVLTNTRAPIVKQILVYKAGSIDEPRGKSGIAHFLEHLMFRAQRMFQDKN